MIEEITLRLAAYQPAERPAEHRHRDVAAVLVPLRSGPKPSVVLTQRSSRLSSHAGEVAWPGGKADPDDASLVDTVLRETQEEIGLQAQDIELVGRLASFVSKYGLWVTPFVGLVQPETALQANPDEIENIFEVPLQFLLNDPRVATEQLDRHNEVQFAPVYEYQNFRIWGLTALILEDFMKFGMGLGVR